jgi:hypothetical protein
MDIKFYHLYIDIDISQAKIFLQSVNIGEGYSDLAGGHGPLLPHHLATGLVPTEAGAWFDWLIEVTAVGGRRGLSATAAYIIDMSCEQRNVMVRDGVKTLSDDGGCECSAYEKIKCTYCI